MYRALSRDIMKHRLYIDWLWWLPLFTCLFDMVPTEVSQGIMTNFFDWTTEVTNFKVHSVGVLVCSVEQRFMRSLTNFVTYVG